MKKILAIFIAVLFLHPQLAFANGAGLPAFFEINGKLSTPNPLQLYGITAQSFLIPQDFTRDNYVVNQPIDFVVDENQLEPVIPQDLMNNTKFDWDFGDGNKTAGLKGTHTYTKIGSYIMTVTINVYTDPDQPPTQFIDSFLMNIIPDKSYNKLPKAVILMNNKQIKTPLDETQNINFNQPISLDARKSIAPSSKIVEYLWNFGDGQTENGPVTTHVYGGRQNYDTVVLRVKDKYGFISDAFVGLNNDSSINNTQTTSKPSSANETHNKQLSKIVAGLLILIAAGVLIYTYFKYKIRK